MTPAEVLTQRNGLHFVLSNTLAGAKPAFSHFSLKSRA